ncbi:glycosyltransferase [Cochlodiniinecator piscidefendens]|uniref:glycosyltransferase n=1 Tax=Cochlodiniinecator piscidefendens TaxID=2715756 RepID=UPI00140A20EF|nr:glycosyltransferase family 2 protein [Cochlodiniinecator piscidefendens]
MSIGIVLIGRNEGNRLARALDVISHIAVPMVYVDSGSTDQSVTTARAAGANVVELRADLPFTAARGRNAGFEALMKINPDIEFVQFIDGDCVLSKTWLSAAKAALIENPDLGIVTGWRSEVNRASSIYNAMCDFEWYRPAGEILTCGGDMMVRAEAFDEVGGFDPTVIAAEDDEFCIRIRNAGWKIRRLPEDMTFHDADMTQFSQWWQRAIRSGHGFAQVGAMHPPYFQRERRRVWIFAALLPLFALIFLTLSPIFLIFLLGAYVLSYLRTVQGLIQNGLPLPEALHHGLYLLISKFPNLIGMLIFTKRQRQGHKMNIIEYK